MQPHVRAETDGIEAQDCQEEKDKDGQCRVNGGLGRQDNLQAHVAAGSLGPKLRHETNGRNGDRYGQTQIHRPSADRLKAAIFIKNQTVEFGRQKDVEEQREHLCESPEVKVGSRPDVNEKRPEAIGNSKEKVGEE